MCSTPATTINLRDRILGLDRQVPLLDGRLGPLHQSGQCGQHAAAA